MESWNGIGKAGKGLQEDEIQPLIPQHLNQLKHSNEYHVQSLLKESGVLEISWSAQKIPGFAINAQRNRDVHGNAANSPKKTLSAEDLGFRRHLKCTTLSRRAQRQIRGSNLPLGKQDEQG